MELQKTNLDGCFLIKKAIFNDHRGFFTETYNKKDFDEVLVTDINFVQDNLSMSLKGVVRGLHYQVNNPQGKLVRVVKGSVFDVAVDLRKNSNTFGKWYGTELNDKNMHQLWIPEGFAHGFMVLSEMAYFEYKCTSFYTPGDEGVIHWKDPDLAIEWPSLKEIVISEKDDSAESFKSFIER
tara:strand:+ start:6757 stop:7299 length:543 start_codon:yes stop_codon:yes gene_type:complete